MLQEQSAAQASDLSGRLRYAVGLVTLTCSACGPIPGGGDAELCSTGVSQEAIVGGTQSSVSIERGAAQRRAIVRVSIPADARNGPLDCTALVVAPGVAVSAGHCFDHDANGLRDDATQAAVILGETGTELGAVGDVWLHPELDVAAFRSSALESAQLGLTTLPLLVGEPADSWIGASAELAGFGTSEHDEPPTLRFVVETIADVTEDHVVVDGGGTSGACAGDSGGPLLVRTSAGGLRALGLLDDGDPRCIGRDRYTRSDRLQGWEPLPALAFQDPPPAPVDCDGR